LRVALASFQHETHSFAPHRTRLCDFEIAAGAELPRRARGTRTALGGFVDGIEALGAELVPLVAAGATPSGVSEAAAWHALRDRLEGALLRAGPVDALALALHGAAIAEGADDVEAELCQRLRDLVGPGVPIVATFDLHGNVAQATADALSLALPCRTYPHVDTRERALEACSFLPDLVARRIAPVTRVERLPLLVPATTTLSGVGAEVSARCAEERGRAGVLACDFFHGFPYGDVPCAGASVVVTTDGGRALAREAARRVARFVWERREEFRARTLGCAEAVARALALPGRPIVIAETSDNPGGGAPGDGTHLLRALVAAGARDACFGAIADPAVARAAHAAGVGALLDVELGGKTDSLHGSPLRARAEVVALSDGRFAPRAMLGGVALDLGPSARLRIGAVDVLVTSRRQQVFDDELFRVHGIEVREKKIVALKSSHHFRAGFGAVAAEILTADPPGLTTLRLDAFERTRTPRPIWPLDPAAHWEG
jgi:microcystin degradation protein MlrC